MKVKEIVFIQNYKKGKRKIRIYSKKALEEYLEYLRLSRKYNDYVKEILLSNPDVEIAKVKIVKKDGSVKKTLLSEIITLSKSGKVRFSK